eukprot:TRINITY_DN14871_c0_g1_i1.p1 TRINITY_DN14871_c0_g1~~TRINITY_DN14871_c0_g1_i1.p1  ORF type:complete len:440 (-),score=102.01 TRINITY_DN14871_c0_g1_i1:122-1390(-)
MAPEDMHIEDLELIGSDSAEESLGEEAVRPLRTSQRRVAAAGLGLLAVAACCAQAFLSGPSTPAAHGALSALTLFDQTDLHEVVANNYMTTRRDLLGGDELGDVASMRRLVAETFRNYSQRLKETRPDTHHVLEVTPLTVEQKDAVVHSAQYLADKRLQNLGLQVARTVRDAKTTDFEQLKKHIAKSLQPRLAEMRQLREEVFPDPAIRQLLGSSDDFENLLHPQRIRLMQTVSDGWNLHFSMSTPAGARRLEQWGQPVTPTQSWGQQFQAPAPAPASPAAGWSSYGSNTNSFGTTTNHPLGTAEAVVGTTDALLEEADAILRIIKPLTKMFGKDLNVDPKVTSGIGLFTALFGIANCEMNAATDGENPVEVAGCPLEFGSEGYDALREVFTLLGILGDNNPKDGEQGNHNGESQVRKGLFA